MTRHNAPTPVYPVVMTRCFERGYGLAFTAGYEQARAVDRAIQVFEYRSSPYEIRVEHDHGLLVGTVSPDAECLSPRADGRRIKIAIVAVLPRDAPTDHEHSARRQLARLRLPLTAGAHAHLSVQIPARGSKAPPSRPNRESPVSDTAARVSLIRSAARCLRRAIGARGSRPSSELVALRESLFRALTSAPVSLEGLCTDTCSFSDASADVLAATKQLPGPLLARHAVNPNDPAWQLSIKGGPDAFLVVARHDRATGDSRVVQLFQRSPASRRLQLAGSTCFGQPYYMSTKA